MVPDGVAATADQPLRHASSVWATETCCEETGVHHLNHRGAVLDAQGWDDDAGINLDGYYTANEETGELL